MLCTERKKPSNLFEVSEILKYKNQQDINPNLDHESEDSDSDTSSPPTPKSKKPPADQTPILPAKPTKLEIIAAIRGVPEKPWTMDYDCAAGCLEPVTIRQGESMRCRMCGTFMLWKKRTKRICYFEAR
jgi:DNA-directed RNA polymerase subunit RPC12/RpoP